MMNEHVVQPHAWLEYGPTSNMTLQGLQRVAAELLEKATLARDNAATMQLAVAVYQLRELLPAGHYADFRLHGYEGVEEWSVSLRVVLNEAGWVLWDSYIDTDEARGNRENWPLIDIEMAVAAAVNLTRRSRTFPGLIEWEPLIYRLQLRD